MLSRTEGACLLSCMMCVANFVIFVYFVCDSASEFGAMGSTSFLGFSCPNLLLVFLNLLFLGTSIIIFFSQVLGLSQFFFLFFFVFFCFSVPYFGKFVSLP